MQTYFKICFGLNLRLIKGVGLVANSLLRLLIYKLIVFFLTLISNFVGFYVMVLVLCLNHYVH